MAPVIAQWRHDMFVIARYYKTVQQAHDVHAALRENGFPSRAIAVVAPSETKKTDEEGKLISAKSNIHEVATSSIRAGRLLAEHADFYASNLKKGWSLVVVQPPFGAVRLATTVLDSHKPVGVTHEEPDEIPPFVPISQRAAPFSEALGWNVLSDKAAPLSEFWGFNTLSRGLSFMSRTFGELGNPHYALTDMFGLTTRSRSPYHGTFGLPLLSGKSGDRWKYSLGLPMLSKGAAPLSNFFGMPLLSSGRSLYR
jgi:hypothetical protein